MLSLLQPPLYVLESTASGDVAKVVTSLAPVFWKSIVEARAEVLFFNFHSDLLSNQVPE